MRTAPYGSVDDVLVQNGVPARAAEACSRRPAEHERIARYPELLLTGHLEYPAILPMGVRQSLGVSGDTLAAHWSGRKVSTDTPRRLTRSSPHARYRVIGEISRWSRSPCPRGGVAKCSARHVVGTRCATRRGRRGDRGADANAAPSRGGRRPFGAAGRARRPPEGAWVGSTVFPPCWPGATSARGGMGRLHRLPTVRADAPRSARSTGE